MWSHINLNKVGSRGQISYMQKKCHWWYHVNLLISEYISRYQKRMLAIDAKKITLMVFSNFKSIYLKHVKSLQSGRKIEFSISNDMWPHVFRSEVGLYIFIFWLHTCFILCFLLYVVIFHLIRRRGFVGIYRKLIPDWIESTRARILFTAQYRTGIQNQIRNTTWRMISK